MTPDDKHSYARIYPIFSEVPEIVLPRLNIETILFGTNAEVVYVPPIDMFEIYPFTTPVETQGIAFAESLDCFPQPLTWDMFVPLIPGHEKNVLFLMFGVQGNSWYGYRDDYTKPSTRNFISPLPRTSYLHSSPS